MRSRNLFEPSSKTPYKLSRSKLALFLECPRCFYLDRRLGIDRIDGPPFTLNVAVDALLKKEFDTYRTKQSPHPLMTKFGIHAIPLQHPSLEIWRTNFTGIEAPYAGFLVTGALDDLWQSPDGAAHVVDYKATSTTATITLEGDARSWYKRQLEVYQWLLRRIGLNVSDTAYLLFANALKDRPMFDARLDFVLSIHAYEGDASWVEDALTAAHECLMDERLPPSNNDCLWCLYRRETRECEK